MRCARRCLAVALAIGGALVLAPAAGAADLGSCAGATAPCVSTSSTPDRISVATSASTTYVRYQATVFNGGGSTMTHVVVQNTLPSGTSLVGIATDKGTCTSGNETCDLGNLASGASATVTVDARGPSTAGTITDTFVTTFTAGDNPGSDPKLSITTRQSTTVDDTAGEAASWVPPGTTTDLSTDPTGTGVATPGQSQIAGARIQAPASGAFASLELTPGAFTCPPKQICRGGDWVEARALVDGVAALFDPPLRFSLRWDASLVPSRQTTRNLAVFYTVQLGTPAQVISRRCSTPNPPPSQLPCLTSVVEERDGDFSAVLVQSHNGYMR